MRTEPGTSGAPLGRSARDLSLVLFELGLGHNQLVGGVQYLAFVVGDHCRLPGRRSEAVCRNAVAHLVTEATRVSKLFRSVWSCAFSSWTLAWSFMTVGLVVEHAAAKIEMPAVATNAAMRGHRFRRTLLASALASGSSMGDLPLIAGLVTPLCGPLPEMLPLARRTAAHLTGLRTTNDTRKPNGD